MLESGAEVASLPRATATGSEAPLSATIRGRGARPKHGERDLAGLAGGKTSTGIMVMLECRGRHRGQDNGGGGSISRSLLGSGSGSGSQDGRYMNDLRSAIFLSLSHWARDVVCIPTNGPLRGIIDFVSIDD